MFTFGYLDQYQINAKWQEVGPDKWKVLRIFHFIWNTQEKTDKQVLCTAVFF